MKNFLKNHKPGIILGFIFVGFTVFLSGCYLFESSTWTIMVYLDADNDLEPFGIMDFNEMEGAKLKRTGIDVIVLMDRIDGYDSSNGNWTDTRLFKLKYDRGGVNTEIVSPELSSSELGLTTSGYEELNMGDPDVCSSFIDFCKAKFPAENYFLVFWNHGSGWHKNIGENGRSTVSGQEILKIPEQTRFICSDFTDYDELYTKEISDSIEGKGIKVVGFDVCYGSMLEVAYEIRNDASYMIASEETESGYGWRYDLWLDNFAASGQSSTNLVNSVVDAYETMYSSYTGATFSGIDLSMVDPVMTAMNNFADKLYSSIGNPTDRDNVKNTLLYDVEDFYYPSGTSDLNLDIWHMADVIQTTYDYADSEAAALKTAVENAVIDEWHHTATGSNGNPNAHGLSIHYVTLFDGKNNDKSIAYYYLKGYSWAHPLDFVSDSTWVPEYPSGPGLLYWIWNELF